MSIDTSKRYINGPVNVVRLQGKIGDVEKVVYLFMDYHLSVYTQTNCEDLLSTNVDKYLARAFKNTDTANKKYDFIFEINPDEIIDTDNSNNKIRNGYIWQLVYLFKFVYQQQKSEDKFRNIRLHYFDIRSYVEQGLDLRYYTYYLRNISAGGYDRSTYNLITTNLNMISGRLQKLTEINSATTPTNAVELIGKNVDPDKKFIAIQHTMNKMKNIYHHVVVKKNLLKYYNNFISQITDFAQKIKVLNNRLEDLRVEFESTKLTDYGKSCPDYIMPIDIRTRKLQPIIEPLSDYSHEIVDVFSNFTDLYMLRRILDKDYITNIIAYSGAYHSKNYIKILVRDFDFEITHASFARKPIGEINREIKNTTDPDKTIFWLFNRDYMTQCSDMTSFPDDFN